MSSTSSNSNDFAHFKVTFFEECAELLSDMEGRLAKMQDAEVDSEELNGIFRTAHSIKAGAGAFGFTALVTFSHTFEAVLDRLRDGHMAQSPRVSAVLMQAGDVLAALVDAAQHGHALEEGFGADVLDDLQSLLDDSNGVTALGVAVSVMKDHPVAADAKPTSLKRRVKIGFAPHAGLLRNANEPLLLLRELRQLGEAIIHCDASRLPSLAAMEPEDAYLSWTIELLTEVDDARLREVFEFVDDCCDLTISDADPVEDVPPQAVQMDIPAQVVPPIKAPKAAAEPSVPTSGPAAKSGNTGSIRVDLPRIDRLVNMVGELVITQTMLAQQIMEHGSSLGLQTLKGQEDLAILTRELQECVMAIRMQPVKSIFQRMPRMVRDISAKLGKQVRLEMSGEQTEVDKTVIEELADPLTHMIRNSIDHGIERPERRAELGKPTEGLVQLSALHVGSNILIQLTDDGAGIDRKILLEKAIQKGIVAPDAKLTGEEIDDLIFAPGFSTAAAVTELSGRGVGMDVVRRNISNLGGRVSVQSTLGKGTKFTMVIPLTLAVLDGMVVAVGDEKFILPLTSIVESYRPEPNSFRTMPGGAQVASIRGEYVQLVYLCDVFSIENAVTDPCKGLVVLVETAVGTKIGVVVDELIGQQQVVIKSLHENYDPVQGVSGATILGNGRVALIIDIEHLSKMTGDRVPHGAAREAA